MDAEMMKIELEEVQSAKEDARDIDGFRLEALDVTKLPLLRPDGHLAPYMYPFPFADGVKDRVQNDCVHWCLPGPIDTWNEILLKCFPVKMGQSIEHRAYQAERGSLTEKRSGEKRCWEIGGKEDTGREKGSLIETRSGPPEGAPSPPE
ncbi:hypothetical protein CDL15_Pgr013284 [Punica granatum]|uniref:Trichome birefringence-like C-terminal domain-containing protein n=1 Tax=Punica granatum TaxID=22663 RepID=A0A218WPT8_PUNGR|nr:hypothetical protein CDL15_Pgr013284 [Punica granatum]PKI34988.1 hypothetical protein CRG98_044619 [Punica granatum]